MTTLALSMADSSTMLRRSLRHIVRYPSMTITLIGMPVVFLLLFVFVFGETLGAGMGAGSFGRSDYANYVTPGIIVITIAAAAQGTAISVAMDMTSGLIARFRTMPISQTSVLTGHVVGSFIQTMVSLLVVVGVAIAVGFRPTATLAEWIIAVGLLGLFTFALTWLSVAFGLVSKSVESASNIPMFLVLLPFFSSGFVRTESMPTALRWFAEYQPFTPVTDAVRGLLLGTPIGSAALVAAVWGIAIAALAFVWAKHLFNRRVGG
jgi:ABC-2 type transport system permease protein